MRGITVRGVTARGGPNTNELSFEPQSCQNVFGQKERMTMQENPKEVVASATPETNHKFLDLIDDFVQHLRACSFVRQGVCWWLFILDCNMW